MLEDRPCALQGSAPCACWMSLSQKHVRFGKGQLAELNLNQVSILSRAKLQTVFPRRIGANPTAYLYVFSGLHQTWLQHTSRA